MARKVRQIHGLKIDEISLVDKGANQHAVVTIAKSADGDYKENEMEEFDIFDEQGNPLSVADLNIGDTVYDDDGNEYVYEYPDDSEQEQEQEERQPEPVGKAFERTPDYAQHIREELSKALTDTDREEIITKALGNIGTLSQQVEIAKAAADQERRLRLEREYTEIAKSYNLPIDDNVLGGVLLRAAENLPREDCEIIAKCMEAAGSAIYEEYGAVGGGDNADIMSQVEAAVGEHISKSANGTPAEMIAEMFSTNPELYDEYLYGN